MIGAYGHARLMPLFPPVMVLLCQRHGNPRQSDSILQPQQTEIEASLLNLDGVCSQSTQSHLCEAVASASAVVVVLGCSSGRWVCLTPAWSGGAGRWLGGWEGGRGWVFRESKSVSKQLARMQQDICIYMYIYIDIYRCIYIYVHRHIGTHKCK